MSKMKYLETEDEINNITIGRETKEVCYKFKYLGLTIN